MPVGDAADVASLDEAEPARRLLPGGGWNVAARVVSAAASLAVVAFASRALPAEELGVLLLLWSTVMLFACLDLGLGHALVTFVADGLHRGDAKSVRATTGMALALVTGGGALLTALLLVAFFNGLGEWVLGGSAAQPTIRRAAVAFLVSNGLLLPLGLGPRILQGAHRVATAARASVVANVVQVGAAAAVAWAGGSLVMFVMVVLVSPILTGGVSLWICAAEGLLGAPSTSDLEIAKSLLSGGLVFSGLAVSGAIAYETDAIVISRVLGPEEVARYAVAARLFLMVPALFSVAFAPLWPVVVGALREGRREWVWRTFHRMRRRSFILATVIAGSLAVFVPVAFAVLAPSVSRPDGLLLTSLVAVAIVQSTSAVYAAVLSGAQLIRAQLVASGAMAVANLTLAFVLTDGIGIAGPALATVITQCALVLLPMSLVLRRRLAVVWSH